MCVCVRRRSIVKIKHPSAAGSGSRLFHRPSLTRRSRAWASTAATADAMGVPGAGRDREGHSRKHMRGYDAVFIRYIVLVIVDAASATFDVVVDASDGPTCSDDGQPTGVMSTAYRARGLRRSATTTNIRRLRRRPSDGGNCQPSDQIQSSPQLLLLLLLLLLLDGADFGSASLR
jgi:hypothetical protein